MCGIIGVISNSFSYSKDIKKVGLELLYANAVRGWDSTGVLWAGTFQKSDETFILKESLPAYPFIQRNEKTFIKNSVKFNNILGHNRAATFGDISDSTAHPFEFGNIVGVHNGTIMNHDDLPDGNRFMVDSQAIINSIDKIGPEETIKMLDGSFALVWFDKRTSTFKAVRNSERPLSFTLLDDEKTVVIASEYKMSRWVLGRNNIKIKDDYVLEKGQLIEFGFDDPRDYDIKEVELRKKTYYYNNNNGLFGLGGRFFPREDYGKKRKKKKKDTKINGDKIKTKDVYESLRKIGISQWDDIRVHLISFYPYKESNPDWGFISGALDRDPWMPVQIHQMNRNSAEKVLELGKIRGTFEGISNQGGVDDVALIVMNEFNQSEDGSKEKNEIVVIDDKDDEDDEKYFNGPNNSLIDKEQWDKLTRHGCCMCNGNIYDHQENEWTSDNQPICESCVDDFKNFGMGI